jgi:hypothetical protein
LRLAGIIHKIIPRPATFHRVNNLQRLRCDVR